MPAEAAPAQSATDHAEGADPAATQTVADRTGEPVHDIAGKDTPARAKPAAAGATVALKTCSPVETAYRFLATLTRPGPLLVAVSGGSDSLALLLALDAARRTLPPAEANHPLLAVTIDHGLRAEAAIEAAAVAQLCAARSIPHETLRWTGAKPQTGLMAAAREARYRLLAGAARRHGAIAILTAHTLTDQAETRAMRQSRSGDMADDGMADAVLHTQSGIWIIRPFLGLARATLQAFLRTEGEGWIDDPSNADPRYERARLRLSGAVSEESPTTATRERESREAAALLADHLHLPVPRIACLAPAFLDALERPAARRALFTLTRVIGGRVHGPGRAAEDRILAFLANGSLDRRSAGRVVFDRRRDGLWLYREARGLPDLALAPRDCAVWDGRLRVENRRETPVRVTATTDLYATEAGLIGAGIPRAIARRAAPAEPVDLSDANVGHVPVLAPWDTFLPRFDLTLADLLARRAGLPAFPPLPAATN
ncbi:tRNA lysidine(34) synthetase TilS [Rhizobium sp. SG2393]|uniref:tRNA lysidine(34) synthetase TilS n=1 Tax=Rhizobium sp. SG2393 TaxID=3276279 RepID=UPI00366AB220